MEKVYCKQCKYLESSGGAIFLCEPDTSYICIHPDNLGGYTDSPLERHPQRTKESVYILNKNNDCSWYERGEFIEHFDI